MTRSPQEIFQHHAQALGAGDLDDIVADYTDDAVFITLCRRPARKDGIRAALPQMNASRRSSWAPGNWARRPSSRSDSRVWQRTMLPGRGRSAASSATRSAGLCRANRARRSSGPVRTRARPG